jgi:hypothetical protein
MESREEVESTGDPVRLQELLRLNKERQQGIVARLAHAFDSPSGSRWSGGNQTKVGAVEMSIVSELRKKGGCPGHILMYIQVVLFRSCREALDLTCQLTYLVRLEEEIVKKLPI